MGHKCALNKRLEIRTSFDNDGCLKSDKANFIRKITIIDTVADNASSGMYVLSDKKVDPRTIDLKKIEMHFYKNEELMNSGVGAAALGDPAFCVAWLANTLWEYGVVLKKVK
ncbi:hypothetical protein [Tissierella sp. Yu-01]|uniref:hypothetical protein n=1 Tax=Tissierella sp. Yu-01 TaxID=3035694 RepID=UPI00240D8556|nr:hypothetical protein [Tissierella sp. Yu-01]WFA08659.1 hypothetical protein P3962_13165 [Tissierella sp. Yu-01]